jgi:hypothetical protein
MSTISVTEVPPKVFVAHYFFTPGAEREPSLDLGVEGII